MKNNEVLQFMQYRNFIVSIVLVAITAFDAISQASPPPPDTIPFSEILDLNPRILGVMRDSIWTYSGICKVLKVSGYPKMDVMAEHGAKHSHLSVRGSVFYDYLYRSYSDTPYYQRGFWQHSIRTSLAVTINEKYTFPLNATLRISNSPYFRNFFNGGLQFDRNSYVAGLKQKVERRLVQYLTQKSGLQFVEAELKKATGQLNNLKFSLSRPDVTQLLIEERLRDFYSGKRAEIYNEIEKGDSVVNVVESFTQRTKKQIDSLQSVVSRLQGQADSVRMTIVRQCGDIKQKLRECRNSKELSRLMRENGITDYVPDKVTKILSDVKSVGIGRTMVNFSELTVNNVALTGISAEYNPGWYGALAVGKLDYGFRDFTGRSPVSRNQHLVTGRVGWGDIERQAVILTVFTGRKYNYGSFFADTVTSGIQITGYAIEGILRRNANVGINVEVAKSTRPVSGRIAENKEAHHLFSFADHSNQAISLKGQTVIQATGTKLNALYRKSGENFQSFALFTYNTDQTAWMLKAEQPFARNRVNVVAMLRRNDFVNPFTEKNFKTSTVFSSVQLSIRLPRMPVLTAGYYPGSQLYLVDHERVRENVYYMANATLFHNYSIGNLRATSSATSNYYTTQSTDSGFVNYNGFAFLLSQSFMVSKFRMTGSFSSTNQRDIHYHTVEACVDFFPRSFISVSGGLKYNRTQSGMGDWGGKAECMIELKKFGGIQVQYDKSFMPTIFQTLFPVEVGRVAWFKYF